MKLSDALQGFYLHMQSSGNSPNTIDNYKNFLGDPSRKPKPITLLLRLGDVEVTDITSEQLVKYMAWLATEYKPVRVNGREGPLASASLSRAWSAIRSFFRWHAEQFGNRRPDKSLKCPKVTQGEIKPFTPDECGRLIKAAKEIKIEPSDGKAAYVMHFASGERNVAIIQTLLDTGIRVGEICRLTINDYNLATGEMRIRPFRSGQKTSGRYVYLGKNAKNAMWRYLTKRKDKEDLLPSDPLFSKKDGLPFDRGGMYWLVRKVGKRAGINDCHPHRFRHTAAFLYIMYGGDAFSLQKMLGHTTMDMSQKYVMMTKQDVQTQHRKSSPVDNLRGLA